jgi:hypothetical protein
LELDISFLARMKFQTGNEEVEKQSFAFMNSFGLALINIDDAPIRLKALALSNVFGTVEDVQYIVSQHYTERLMTNALSVVGSTEILGNPA